jgi:type IV pilus assembly protein PilA
MKNQIQSKLQKKRLIGKVRGAFSLVELLVVIAVIGIIAAIAIPNIAGITGQADTAKAQRNAQSLASTLASARAAGNVDVFADKAAAVTAVVGGIKGAGPFVATDFKVPGLSADEQTAALDYLTLSANAPKQLEYSQTPVAPPAP